MREPEDRFSRRLSWAVLALVLLVVAGVRARLLDVPLERDEGEYAYIGSLLLRGVAPWAEAWNMKLPGVYAVYALLIALGGPSVVAIHAGLLAASTWNALACAALARRLFGAGPALVAGAAYASLALSTAVLGLWAHAEPFALSLALPGLWLALGELSPGRVVAAALLLGAAFVVKQNAAALALFGGLWLGWRAFARGGVRAALRQGALFAAAAALPFALTVLALLHAGVFQRFWFWTVSYATSYGGQMTLADGIGELSDRLPELWRAQALWWLAAAAGLASALSRALRAQAPFLLGLFAAGFACASMGFYYRPQYFVLLLPALALLAAAAAQAWAPAAPRARALACAGLAVAGLATPIGVERGLLLRASPDDVARAVYGVNPFPEARVLAREIAADSAPDARVGVIGSEPELYFYSGRRAATGYVYTYPLMEPQPHARAMQEEMIAELEAARPELLVFVNVPTSWLVREGSPQLLFAWAAQTLERDYETVAVADIWRRTPTQYVFGDAARSYTPRSPYWVSVLRRKRA